MTRWLRAIERKLGRFAIPHTTVALVAVQVVMYIAAQTNPDLIPSLALDPEAVRKGEVWRLISFVFIPPPIHPLWAFFAWYLFWLMGSALDHTWGTFRYNVYLLVAVVMTWVVLFAFNVPGDNLYIGASVFLAFAALYPDFELRLFFVLPIKVKWLALLQWLMISWVIGRGLAASGPEMWDHRTAALMAAAAVVNFFLFCGGDVVRWARTSHRRMSRRIEAMQTDDREPFHRCVVCGKTDQTHPDEHFRYDHDEHGDAQCYCEQHLPGGADNPVP